MDKTDTKVGRLGESGKTYRPLREIEMELARTKKELAIVKMERDIGEIVGYAMGERLIPMHRDEPVLVPGGGSQASSQGVTASL